MAKFLKIIDNIEIENKYLELLEYLKQDDGYWLYTDRWDLKKNNFYGKTSCGTRHIRFNSLKKEILKNECKYFILRNFKENLYKIDTLRKISNYFKYIEEFLTLNYKNIVSISEVTDETEMLIKWNCFLLSKNTGAYKVVLKLFYEFMCDYYSDLDETEKDVWYARNIKGAKISACTRTGIMNFKDIPNHYKSDIKKYFSVMITRKSYRTCAIQLSILKQFFRMFYQNGYKDGFLENLTRKDVEKYLYWLNEKEYSNGSAHKSKCVSYINGIIKYMQLSEYSTAPKTDAYKLFFDDDVPRRENSRDIIKRVKYIPEPVLEQIDNNIDSIKDENVVAVYKLARESGWRGTAILNLRYDNCLEQIWNSKENKYNYYLCGEITKTGIAELKVPIHEEIAHMVEKMIIDVKNKSTEQNNPKKYLFNTYIGKSKGRPIRQLKVVFDIRKMIADKNILDSNGELYHFKLHSLRHTRAKEYIEQGLGIEIVQQMLGHRSLQMTVHYATVSENILYEKWKETEKLQLFKVNADEKRLEKIDVKDEQNDKIIKYEYVKENLDAVKVPFGICFKSKKIQCKNQINQCLECASFCASADNIDEFKVEIERVKKQIEIAKSVGRNDWIEKNTQRLTILEKFLERLHTEKIIHKNADLREEY